MTPQEKYDKKNAKRYSLKFNLKYDKAIIDKLSRVDNVQGYIKQLILADIGFLAPKSDDSQ